MTRSQSVVRYLVGTYKSPTSMFAPLWRVVPLNATTEQVLGLELAEQRAYLENLWQFNHRPQQARSASHDDLYGHSKGIGFLRRFNQLPCTVESRRARADLLREMDPAACRILILGDDDLLAVELALTLTILALVLLPQLLVLQTPVAVEVAVAMMELMNFLAAPADLEL